MRRILFVAWMFVACDHEKPPGAVTVPAQPSATASTSATSAPNETSAPSSDPTLARNGLTDVCKADDECTLTRYQEGCCVSACATYAVNEQSLAAVQKKEHCETVRNSNKCPPPAPCPPEKRKAAKAMCHDGRCRVAYGAVE